MREISFRGKLSCEDYRKYNAYHFKRRYIIISIILFSFYFIVFTGAMINRLINIYVFIYIALISLAFSLLTTAFIILIGNKKVKKLYNSSPRIKIESIYKTIFKGILVKTDQGTRLFKWRDMHKAVEKRGLIILYISSVQALIIPREYFENDQDFLDFKDIVKEKVNK